MRGLGAKGYGIGMSGAKTGVKGGIDHSSIFHLPSKEMLRGDCGGKRIDSDFKRGYQEPIAAWK